MKKVLVAALAAGLVGAMMVAPVAAKKKPGRKLTQTDLRYYLVDKTPAGEICTEMVLLLAPGGTSTACGAGESGPVNEAGTTAFGPSCTTPVADEHPCAGMHYEAAEALPLVLDATKKVTGTIVVEAWGHTGTASTSAGPAVFNLALRGTVAGEEKVIASFSFEYTVTPQQPSYEIPVEIELPSEMDKAQLTTFGIDMWNTGVAPLSGHYRTNESTLVLPVWKSPAR